MAWNKKIAAMAAAAVLTFTMLLTAAVAAPPAESGFSALQGVDAQMLPVEDMKAISGELNAIDIGNNLLKLAASVTNPTLSAALTKLGNYYLANATTINAFFAKLGILTPCTTC